MAEASAQNVNLIQVADDGQLGNTDHSAPRIAQTRWPVLEQLLEAWPVAVAEAMQRQWGLAIAVQRRPLELTGLDRVSEGFDSGALAGSIATGQSDEALILIEPVCLYGVLEFILGDRSKMSPQVPERLPTPFEAGLMRPLVAIICDTFRATLLPAGALSLAHRAWDEPKSQAAPALLASLTMTFGQSSGSIVLAIPLSVLGPLADALGGVLHGRDVASAHGWRNRLTSSVGEARVLVTAFAYQGIVPLRRLAALGPGETLALDCPVDAPAVLTVSGREIGIGRIGRAGDAIAIRLDGPCTTGGMA